MVELHQTKELTGEELTDLGSFVNTIVVHITDGNDVEKEATSRSMTKERSWQQ